jgi:hypothetical protein
VDKSTTDISAWQTLSIVRRVLESRIYSFSFSMIEHSAVTMSLWLDQALPTPVDGEFTLDLSSSGDQVERAVLLRIRDGERLETWYASRCVLSEGGDVEYNKSDAVPLPVTLTALDDSGSSGSFTLLDSAEVAVLAATGAVAGLPGYFTPLGATLPDDLADLQSSGVAPTPNTDWGDDYVLLADDSSATWDGDSWIVTP